MSRCGVDADPDGYSLLKSVPGASAPDRRYRFEWMALPNRVEPEPAPLPVAALDLDDEHGGWYPV